MKSGVASHIMAVECLMAAGLKPKGDVYINVVIDEEVSGHGTLDTVIRGLQGRRRHFRRDQRPRGAARMHRPDLVRDRDPRQARRHSKALRGHQRHRTRQQDREGGRGSGGKAGCDGHAPLYPNALDTASLHHRQLLGRQLSERIPGQLSARRAASAPFPARTTKGSSRASWSRWRARQPRIPG